MRGSTPSSSSGRERIALPISPRKCSPAIATALRRSLEVQSTTASHRRTKSAEASTGTPHLMSSRLNAACMLAWAASWRRKASTSARWASLAMRSKRRRASSMKKLSTAGAIVESASKNTVAPMPTGCHARGISYSRPSKSKRGRRGMIETPTPQVEVGFHVRSSVNHPRLSRSCLAYTRNSEQREQLPSRLHVGLAPPSSERMSGRRRSPPRVVARRVAASSIVRSGRARAPPKGDAVRQQDLPDE